MLRTRHLIALLPLMLTACAANTAKTPEIGDQAISEEQRLQLESVARRSLNQRKMLYEVSDRIARANAPLCEDRVAPSLGVSFLKPADLDVKYASSAFQDVFDLTMAADTSFYVVGLSADSPAMEAGLQRGDRLKSFNGNTLFTDKDKKPLTPVPGVNKIAVTRGTEELEFDITPAQACDFPVALRPDTAVNAAADGDGIFFTTGMMNFINSEEQVALVYSHELAHNTLGHLESKRANAMAGAAVGLVADVALSVLIGVNPGLMRAGSNLGALAYSTSFEKEADYVGLYYMARAGYDTGKAPEFWRRMATENDSRAIQAASTHPTTAERFVLLETTHSEIVAKDVDPSELRPNLQE